MVPALLTTIANKLKWQRSTIAVVLLSACLALHGLGMSLWFIVGSRHLLPTEGTSVSKNVTIKANAWISHDSKGRPVNSSSRAAAVEPTSRLSGTPTKQLATTPSAFPLLSDLPKTVSKKETWKANVSISHASEDHPTTTTTSSLAAADEAESAQSKLTSDATPMNHSGSPLPILSHPPILISEKVTLHSNASISHEVEDNPIATTNTSSVAAASDVASGGTPMNHSATPSPPFPSDPPKAISKNATLNRNAAISHEIEDRPITSSSTSSSLATASAQDNLASGGTPMNHSATPSPPFPSNPTKTISKNATLNANSSISHENGDRPITSSSTSSSLAAASALYNLTLDGTLTNHSSKPSAFPLSDRAKQQQELASPSAECARNISTIYLHIGPPKTGTTTIQNFCACHSSLLQQHNTCYLGKVNGRDLKLGIPNCEKDNAPKDFVRPMVQYNDPKGMKALKHELEQHVAMGHNVILSDEDFTRVSKLIERMFDTFDKTAQFNIVPILVYRRYHDMVLSLYYFVYRPKSYERGWKTWNSFLDIPTFRSFWQQPKNQEHAGVVCRKEVLGALDRAHQHHNSTVNVCPLVFNMHHEGTDILTQFVDKVIIATGEATNDTSAAASPTGTQLVSNKGSGTFLRVDSEILAVKLKQEGRLHEKFSRRIVVQKLYEQMQTLYGGGNATKPPLDCLNAQEHQQLYKMSLESEMTMLPLESQSQEKLRNSFESSVAQDRFCNIRLDEMLLEEGWQPLLSCLQGGENWCGK